MRAAALLLLAAWPAQARVLAVGPGQAFTLPSAAVAAAQPGDSIEIAPGEYFDCISVRADKLTIRGTGLTTVLTDKICDGKAQVVTQGQDIVLQDLTLQRARAPDGNGAGIRAEGRNLTVERLQFLNGQGGMLAADMPDSTIVLRDSRFAETGICNEGGRCTNSVSVGRIERLVVERTVITGTRGGHQIVSSAALTELRHDTLEDGTQGRASLQLQLPNGGSLIMEDCVVQKGPHAASLRAAVLLDGHSGGLLAFRRNRYVNDTGQAVPFIVDWSDGTPELQGNTIPAGDDAVSTAGLLRHRAGGTFNLLKADARGVAGSAVRGLKSLFGH